MVAQVQFVCGDTVEPGLAKRLAGGAETHLLHLLSAKRMLEVQAGAGAIREVGEVGLNAGEVIGSAAAVGVVTDDQSLLCPANVGQPPKCLVHAEFAGQPDPGMTARQVGQVQQVDGQPVVASGLEPILRLAKRLPICS